jgi:hypothetical protein
MAGMNASSCVGLKHRSLELADIPSLDLVVLRQHSHLCMLLTPEKSSAIISIDDRLVVRGL